MPGRENYPPGACFGSLQRLNKQSYQIKMKNKMQKIVLLLALSLGLSSTIMAQPGGGFQRRTPEERAAQIHAKLDSAFKLEPAKLATLDTALIVLYKKQDEKLQSMFSGGERPDRETMREEMKKYSDARDEMIKAMVTEEQYKIWKEKIEPGMRMPRRDGSNPGNG
jgi:protein CpxP